VASDAFGILNRTVVATFGQLVLYQPATGQAFSVKAILERSTDEQRHTEGVYARLFVNLADFVTTPEHGDELTVAGKTYKVYEVLSDPTRGAWLALRES
jgi:hypothetical protein